MLMGLALIFGTLAFGINQKKNNHIKKINVNIFGLPDGKYLIKSEDVYNMLSESTSFDIDRAALKDFNIRAIETMLNKDARIKNAEVYISKLNEMFIQIEQKEPIVRVSNANGGDYYLDLSGSKIPVDESSTVRVPVATGYVGNYDPEYMDKLNNPIADIYYVSKKIYQDNFLSSLVEQIHLESDGEITMVPKLGDTKIRFGVATELDEKFFKLKTYYKDIKKFGIDKFATINLSFEEQIVGKVDKEKNR